MNSLFYLLDIGYITSLSSDIINKDGTYNYNILLRLTAIGHNHLQ